MTETSVTTTETTQQTPETPKVEENGHTEEEQQQVKEESNGAENKEEKKEDPVKEMRAIVLLNFGGYKGVKILKKPEPTPQNGEVLIRVKAW